jgi:hypothetical protein
MVPVIEALETHAGVSARSWEGVLHRPDQYPSDLPFLAGHPAAILAVGGSTTIEWEEVPSPLVERMARDLVIDGWEETTLPERSIPGMLIRIFRRKDRQRVVLHSAGRLTLLDTRAE